MDGSQVYPNPYENATTLQDWMIQFRSIKEIWDYHPTNLAQEINFYAGGLITLIHALLSGGRYPFLWLITIFHGCWVEIFSYFVPDVDNFWHAQTSIMFVGGRLPLHIMLLYPTFQYTSSVAVAHLRLKKWIEPFAVGLCVVLIDLPYDIIGIKHLWWTWHDTDPNIYDRFYWVPWTSFYFHTTFAASLMFFYELIRKRFVGKDKYDSQHGSIIKELLACLIASPFGLVGGIMLFMPLYHPLHDLYGIYTGNIVSAAFIIISVLIWCFDRFSKSNTAPKKHSKKDKSYNGLLMAFLAFHYLLYVMLAVFGKPENVVFIGFHEPTGDCDKYTSVHTPIGKVLQKRTYLCVTDYHEDFDWHCLPGGKPPSNGQSWYTVCGTPYVNQAEYIFVLTAIGITALIIYFQMLYCSADSLFRKEKLKVK